MNRKEERLELNPIFQLGITNQQTNQTLFYRIKIKLNNILKNKLYNVDYSMNSQVFKQKKKMQPSGKRGGHALFKSKDLFMHTIN